MLTAMCLKSIWRVQTLRFAFRHAYLKKMIADNACYGTYFLISSLIRRREFRVIATYMFLYLRPHSACLW